MRNQARSPEVMGLTSVNLSLSCLCGGNCIFCPTDRGQMSALKAMPLAYAKRIADEVASPRFRREHQVRRFEIGENGDAFLNREAIAILRYLKKTNPDVSVEAFTNFANLSKEKSQVILEEGLLDSVYCNIDGCDARNYFLAKRLSLDVVRSNIRDFLALRTKIGANTKLTILSLTPHYYVQKLRNGLGAVPSKLGDPDILTVSDDFNQILEEWKSFTDPRTDAIRRAGVVGWAERSNVESSRIDYSKYSCPNLPRVREECFVAPDGTWYLCCLDSKNSLRHNLDVTADDPQEAVSQSPNANSGSLSQTVLVTTLSRQATE